MDFRYRFKTIAVAFFVLSIIVSIYLTRVFITTLLLSVFMVYLLYPLYTGLLRLTGDRQISATATITAASVMGIRSA